MLVEHGVHDMDERFITVEEPVSPGEEVPLEPSLAQMLREDLHDSPIRGQMVVAWFDLGVKCPIGDLEHRAEPVRSRFIGTEQPECVRVAGQ